MAYFLESPGHQQAKYLLCAMWISLHLRHNERDGVKLTGVSIVCSTICSSTDKKSKAPRHWHLSGESNGYRWIPLTKGQ